MHLPATSLLIMPDTGEITATIIDMLAESGWVIMPCAGESDSWLVTRDSPDPEILLALPRAAVASYVGGLIAGYLPHEVIDGVGPGPIADEVAATAAASLETVLAAAGPGLLTEVGIGTGLEGNGPEIYSIRAMRAVLTD